MIGSLVFTGLFFMGVLDRVTGLCFFLSWMAHLVIFLVFGFMNFFYWSLVFFFWHFPFGPCGAAPHGSAIHFPVLIPFFDSSAAVGCQEYKKERKKEKRFFFFFFFFFCPFRPPFPLFFDSSFHWFRF